MRTVGVAAWTALWLALSSVACGDASMPVGAPPPGADAGSSTPPASRDSSAGADAALEGVGPLRCAATELACNGKCAACPSGEGVARTSCGREGCVATCEDGYDLCGSTSGCCKALVFTSVQRAFGGRDLSIMFDKADGLHIGYGGFIPNDSLYYIPAGGQAAALASSRSSPYGSISMRSSAILDASDVATFAFTYESVTWPEVHLARRSPGGGNFWSSSPLSWLSGNPRVQLAQGGGVVAIAYSSPSAAGVSARRLDDPMKSFLSCPGAPGAFDLAFRVDDGGVPHMVCHGTSSSSVQHYDDVLYATLGPSGSPVLETVDAAFSEGRSTQSAELALAADGTPHVAYVDVVKREIVHARRKANVWTRTSVAPLAASVPATLAPNVELGLVVDGSGDAHLFFAQGTGLPMFHARQSAAGFVVRPIAAAPWVSREIEAARDSKGSIHVLYQASPAANVTLLSTVP